MSASQGWVKLHRVIMDHPRFTDGGWLKLWLFLLCRATHTELERVFDGKVMTLKPGQLITSRDSISKSCDIDRSKVERLLKTLKNEQQIEQRSCTTCRLITILNWERYQKVEQPNEQQVSNERAASEQRVSTHKNAENEENGKNDKNKYTERAFDEFWEIYPKKVAKIDAETAWRELNLTPNLEAILDAVEWQFCNQQDLGDRYVPYPAKWLRDRRWEDESPYAEHQVSSVTNAELPNGEIGEVF